MKTTKRIFAFTMAVMICVSYCMMHISAAGREFYEYYGNNLHYFPGGNGSYAYVHCDIPGWNEETYTDFIAKTYAVGFDYGDDNVYYCRAQVWVSLFYDDEWLTIRGSDYAVCDANVDNDTATATVRGNDLIDMDHGIGFVDTEHEVDICIKVGEDYVRVEQIGPTINIGSSY